MKLLKIKACHECPFFMEQYEEGPLCCIKTGTLYDNDDERFIIKDIPTDCPLEEFHEKPL